jgi:two-component system OmpR family response regulator
MSRGEREARILDFGDDADGVESHVSYLRRKVDTTEPRLIHTPRSIGYVLREAQPSRA